MVGFGRVLVVAAAFVVMAAAWGCGEAPSGGAAPVMVPQVAPAAGAQVAAAPAAPSGPVHPWAPAAYEKVPSLHLLIWSLSETDEKELADVVKGKRTPQPVLGELWYEASPPRLRVDLYSGRFNPKAGFQRIFEGRQGGSREFEGKPFELYQRVLQAGTRRRTFELDTRTTVFNSTKPGRPTGNLAVYKFSEAVTTATTPTVKAALDVLEVRPFLFGASSADNLTTRMAAEQKVQPERYAQFLSGLAERTTFAGRSCARLVHDSFLTRELRDDLVDLELSMGLTATLKGWGRTKVLTPWPEPICLYRVVELSTGRVPDEVFTVW